MTTIKSKTLKIDYFSYVKSFFNLMKPRVMSLVIFTCAVGLLIAPVKIDFTNAYTSKEFQYFRSQKWPKEKWNNLTMINKIDSLVKNYENQLGNINQKFENKIDKIQSGDELLPGVLKLIKVFIAVKNYCFFYILKKLQNFLKDCVYRN